MTILVDDIRAAVGKGTISEAQAADIIAQSEARQGFRQNLSDVDEPFELFKGFNEIFVVSGLTILFIGFAGLTSIFSVSSSAIVSLVMSFVLLIGLGFLSQYFTLKRRMIAPSIALVIMFAIGAAIWGFSLGLLILPEPWEAYTSSWGYSSTRAAPMLWLISVLSIVIGLLIHWWRFRVPFSMALIALAVFATVFSLMNLQGIELDSPAQVFLLTGTGPFSFVTVALGVIGFLVAMYFDISDPHRVTRRAAQGFWLHVISAPAIVNTVSISLISTESAMGNLVLFFFLVGMAILAIIIDRRSFLIAGLGYVVALAAIVSEGFGGAFILIFIIGALLVFLGAAWERVRARLMNALPNFPGKSNLPPWAMSKDAE